MRWASSSVSTLVTDDTLGAFGLDRVLIFVITGFPVTIKGCSPRTELFAARGFLPNSRLNSQDLGRDPEIWTSRVSRPAYRARSLFSWEGLGNLLRSPRIRRRTFPDAPKSAGQAKPLLLGADERSQGRLSL